MKRSAAAAVTVVALSGCLWAPEIGLAAEEAVRASLVQSEMRSRQREPSFVVPHYESEAARASGRRSATLVRVSNPRSGQRCDVDVEFVGRKAACAVNRSLRPGESGSLCSRRVSHPLAGCSASCPAAAIGVGSGRAYVYSSCPDLEVSAQVVYTRDRLDMEFVGVSDLAVERAVPQLHRGSH